MVDIARVLLRKEWRLAMTGSWRRWRGAMTIHSDKEIDRLRDQIDKMRDTALPSVMLDQIVFSP